MGRYQRKPYKKQKIDRFLSKAIKDEIEDELDLFFDQDQEESVLLLDEEPMLFDDEPEIVKQLREEEFQGKLPTWIVDFNKETDDEIISETSDSSEETFSNHSMMNHKRISLMKLLDKYFPKK